MESFDNMDATDAPEALHVWPAFVDLLAASSLLFVCLVAVFIYYANREAGEFVTQKKTLIAALNSVQGGSDLFVLHDDPQFIRITLQERATFPSRRWELDSLYPSGRRALFQIGHLLKTPKLHPLYRQIRILGHTDQEPMRGRMTNWELSAARAAVVARFLVDSAGVDPCKISASGLGPYYPASIQDRAISLLPYPERMEKNRRIEVEIIPAHAPGSVEGPPCYQPGDGSAPRASAGGSVTVTKK